MTNREFQIAASGIALGAALDSWESWWLIALWGTVLALACCSDEWWRRNIINRILGR